MNLYNMVKMKSKKKKKIYIYIYMICNCNLKCWDFSSMIIIISDSLGEIASKIYLDFYKLKQLNPKLNKQICVYFLKERYAHLLIQLTWMGLTHLSSRKMLLKKSFDLQ